MPLDKAIYNPVSDTIFAVRGGTIFELSATTAEKISSSRFHPSGMSPS